MDYALMLTVFGCLSWCDAFFYRQIISFRMLCLFYKRSVKNANAPCDFSLSAADETNWKWKHESSRFVQCTRVFWDVCILVICTVQSSTSNVTAAASKTNTNGTVNVLCTRYQNKCADISYNNNSSGSSSSDKISFQKYHISNVNSELYFAALTARSHDTINFIFFIFFSFFIYMESDAVVVAAADAASSLCRRTETDRHLLCSVVTIRSLWVCEAQIVQYALLCYAVH